MQRPADPDDYELREEYDLAEMTVVAKGRHVPRRRAGKNVVLLDEDLVTAFPTDQSVNEALRLVMRISEVRAKYSAQDPESWPPSLSLPGRNGRLLPVCSGP